MYIFINTNAIPLKLKTFRGHQTDLLSNIKYNVLNFKIPKLICICDKHYLNHVNVLPNKMI